MRGLCLIFIAVLLVGCPGPHGKVDIGGIVVDATNLEGDKVEFGAASKRWHAGKRSFSDEASKADADVIDVFCKKNYRSALSLSGSVYATEAMRLPVAERPIWYHAARSRWKTAAMLGDENSIQIMSVNYRIEDPLEPVEAAAWGLVAIDICRNDTFFATNSHLASRSMAELSETDRDIARRRADALIKQIRENREIYDKVVGKDI